MYIIHPLRVIYHTNFQCLKIFNNETFVLLNVISKRGKSQINWFSTQSHFCVRGRRKF